MQTPQAKAQQAAADPRLQAQHIREMLQGTIDQARRDLAHTNDAKALALFETTAEVLQGLATAYVHYERQSEPAWQ